MYFDVDELKDIQIITQGPSCHDVLSKQLELLGGAAYLLSLACMTAREFDDAGGAFKFVHLAEDCATRWESDVFDVLRDAAITYILRETTHDEFYYQELFKRYAADVLDGAKVIEVKENPSHKPDAWVDFEGGATPVEVKLDEFNESALCQLQRYMNVYDSQRGVAVARSCAAELPANIVWVPLQTLDEKEHMAREERWAQKIAPIVT